MGLVSGRSYLELQTEKPGDNVRAFHIEAGKEGLTYDPSAGKASVVLRPTYGVDHLVS